MDCKLHYTVAKFNLQSEMVATSLGDHHYYSMYIVSTFVVISTQYFDQIIQHKALTQSDGQVADPIQNLNILLLSLVITLYGLFYFKWF